MFGSNKELIRINEHSQVDDIFLFCITLPLLQPFITPHAHVRAGDYVSGAGVHLRCMYMTPQKV